MNDHDQHKKNFLKEQLQWCKEQEKIYEEIHITLIEMKEIADYALNNELEKEEIESLNSKLNDLKEEVLSLEEQIQTFGH